MQTTSNYTKHNCRNPIQKVLVANFYRSLFSLFKRTKAASVLDVGCGEGVTINKLKESYPTLNVEGLDYSSEAIQIGKKVYPNLKLIQGDIYKLPYKDNSFDAVLCNEVLEHLDDPQKALGELKRVTKKHLILSVPNEPFFMFANLLRGKNIKHFGNHPEHIQHWTTFKFSQMLNKYKLKIITKKHPFAWTVVLAQK